MKKVFFTLTFFAIILTSFGQNVWQQLYNNNTANTFTQSQENKFILAGSEYESMMQKWNIFQTDSVGNIQWDTTFIQLSEGIPGCIESTPDTGYYCLASKSNTKVMLLKINESGDTLWTKTINNDYIPISMIKTNDSLFVFLANDFINNPRLVKTDSIGDIITTLQELNNSNRNKLKCFPNPFENEITFEIDRVEGYCDQLTIYNIIGEVIFSKTDFFMSSEKINSTSLKKGIYIVELSINNAKYTSLIEKK